MEDFEAIYVQHFDGVYKYVFSLCRNETMAEEITQETFYRAMEHIDKFEGKCKLYVWLCQIEKNTLHTYAKKQKRHVSETDIDLSKQIEPSFENEILDKETVWKLHKLLHELSDPYKEVFMLRILGELKFKEISAVYGKTESWAKVTFYRAKNKLIELMEDMD